MRTNYIIRLITLMATLVLGSGPLMAAEDHKAEAMKHAQAALESGKLGNAAAIGEHAGAAKVHAEAAQQERPNVHLEAAIKSLDSAIEESKKGNAALAEEAAFGAVTHLKAAEKSF